MPQGQGERLDGKNALCLTAPPAQYFDLFRVRARIDDESIAALGGPAKAVRHLSSVLLDSHYRREWDTRCLKNGTLAKVGKAQYIGLYGAQSPAASVIANRDFVTLKTWRYNHKGAQQHVFVNRSVQWASYGPQPNYVRGRSFQTGNVVRWSDSHVELIYVTQSDLRGWIPAWVVNTVTGSVAPDMITKMVAAAKGYDAWLAQNKLTEAFERLHPDKDPDNVQLDINEIFDRTDSAPVNNN